MKIYNLSFLLLFLYLFAFPTRDNQQKLNKNKPAAVNVVFKSSDGGQTWQDISEGLPENWEANNFFANESGLYMSAGNGIYHSKSTSKAPFWDIEIFPNEHRSIAPGKTGIFAFKWDGLLFTKNKRGEFVVSQVQRFQSKRDTHCF